MSTCTIEIDSVDLVFDYNYRATEITDHMCRICNEHLMQSIFNKKDNTIDAKVALGKCGHSFHISCIENYRQKQQDPKDPKNPKNPKNQLNQCLCPIDHTEWVQKKIFDNKNTFGKLILSDINYIESPAIHYRTQQKK